MKKTILLLFVLLFLVGCQTGGPSFGDSIDEDMHTGNEGLVITFGPESPPSRVFELDDFPVTLELENKGTFDIRNGIILLNLERDYTQLTRGNNVEDIDLLGRSVQNPNGDQDIKTFIVKALDLGTQTETLTTNIIVTSCYKYKTEFSRKVCVDTDFYNVKQAEKACHAEDLTFRSGQGAPVAVTKIETKPLQDEDFIMPRFIIHVENQGDGQVTSTSRYQNLCSSDEIDYNEINKINVNAFLGDEAMTCSPKVLKLRQEDSIIRCTLENGFNKDIPSYSTLLTVKLDYGYSQSISKQVEIRSEI